jgi:hypothetical protein
MIEQLRFIPNNLATIHKELEAITGKDPRLVRIAAGARPEDGLDPDRSLAF